MVQGSLALVVSGIHIGPIPEKDRNNFCVALFYGNMQCTVITRVRIYGVNKQPNNLRGYGPSWETLALEIWICATFKKELSNLYISFFGCCMQRGAAILIAGMIGYYVYVCATLEEKLGDLKMSCCGCIMQRSYVIVTPGIYISLVIKKKLYNTKVSTM
jgi:hypothetical protein